MRIVDIRERSFSISRYADPGIPSGGLTTSAVALVTDSKRGHQPVVGYGFSSFGRFGQSGLIGERFAPRLLAAAEGELASPEGDNIDPFRAWDCMMRGEKHGGHGERCVAVGTLDMALWDLAAKRAEQPLFRYLASKLGAIPNENPVPVYAAGGYYFPDHEITRLKDEVNSFLDEGYTVVKIKIGGRSQAEDLRRIEAVLSVLPGSNHLAVDAMNCYDAETAIEVAKTLAPLKLRWFEDFCDPLDFETHATIVQMYESPVAAGEALFSFVDARNLMRYGGLRPERDLLLFDPVHCYGLSEYLRILSLSESRGWPRSACQPHGGHLFALHVTAALRLGGCESNPLSFAPWSGFGCGVKDGCVCPPNTPGIGFEARKELNELFCSLT